MKITQRYGLIVPIILLQVTASVWGMNPSAPQKKHYQALANTWQQRDKFSPEDPQTAYAQILTNQKIFQERFKGHESPVLPKFPLKANFPETYYKYVTPNATESSLEFRKAIVQYAQQTIPLFSQTTLKQACTFYQSHNYSESMTITDFFVRLYTKRPLACYTGIQGYKIIVPNNEGIYVPFSKYDTIVPKLKAIGTSEEKSPFILANILSLEEAEIAALCGVSSPTFFINNGNRQNQGYKPIDLFKAPFEELGIQIGLVGSNHEIPGFFGYKNLFKNGMPGDIEITSDNVNTQLTNYKAAIGLYYRPSMAKEHIKDILANALYEADARGKHANKDVFLHIVGLGLGAWQLFKTTREDIEVVNLIAAVKEILEDPSNRFKNISNIDFSWINPSDETLARVDIKREKQTIAQVKISFSDRNPSAKLIDENAGKLVVAIYPWDGYAYVGNEYWDGCYSASGDPAAACSSLIPTLQNPEINHFFVENIETAVINALEQIVDTNIEIKNDTETQSIDYNKILEAALTKRDQKKALEAADKAAAEKQEQEALQKRLAQEKAAAEQAEKDRIVAQQAAEKKKQEDLQKELVQKAATEKTVREQKDALEKANNKTFISKLLSYRPAQAITIMGAIGSLCYLLTTAEQKGFVTSTLTHYWEKLSSYITTSARYS